MINGRRIGIDARMIEMSGIGTYIQHLMNRGIYDCAVGKEEEIRKYDPVIDVIPFDAKIYGLKEQFLFPEREVRKAGIDLMHFPHYDVPLKYQGRYVVTVHDLTHIVFPEFLGKRIKYLYAKLLMSHALHNAEHVFTVSEYSRQDIVKHFHVPEEAISITCNAVDDDFAVKPSEETAYLYESYGIKKDWKKLLFVGNLKPHKNLSTLLKALQLLDEDTVLLLVGKAFDIASMSALEQSMGISSRVIHTGLVSKQELVDFYNLADVFVFPSLYEGFGIPPLEAMACGTPVIASNCSSIPEVTGDAAVLFDADNPVQLADEIRRVLSDNRLYKDLQEKGLKRCRYFSWNSSAETIRSVLSSVV